MKEDLTSRCGTHVVGGQPGRHRLKCTVPGSTGLCVGIVAMATFAAIATHAVCVAAEELDIMEHLTLSASDRMRGEFVSWFNPMGDRANNNYAFFANRARVGATLAFPTVVFFAEAQDTRLVNLPGEDSIASGVGPLGPGALYFANTRDRDQGEPFLHRAYATVRRFGLPGVAVSVGRLGYNHGLEKVAGDPTVAWLQKKRISQRLIGNFDYTHVGRSFDGVKLMYDRDAVNFTAFVSHPTAGGFNVNANKTVDEIDLISGTLSVADTNAYGPFSSQLFYVYYKDRRDLVATDNRPLNGHCESESEGYGAGARSCDDDDIAISTIGANIVQVLDLGPGRADILAWGATQVGDWESLEHDGWAYAAEVGYQLPETPCKPWLRVGFFRSSGDSDPSDSDHETFFQIIPTARLYADFPFFNMMNNQDLFVQGMAKPIEGGTLLVSGHWLRATESADLWYAGGGATSDTFFGYGGIPAAGRHELAYLVDLALTYKINEHLKVYGYYGHAFGQGIVTGSFCCGNDADYGYIETTVSF